MFISPLMFIESIIVLMTSLRKMTIHINKQKTMYILHSMLKYYLVLMSVLNLKCTLKSSVVCDLNEPWRGPPPMTHRFLTSV